MGLIKKMGSGTWSVITWPFKDKAPRWVATLLLATTILGCVGTGYAIFDNDEIPVSYKAELRDELAIIKLKLSEQYGSIITDIVSVKASKKSDTATIGTLNIIALAKTTKGKSHYVSFEFDVSSDKITKITEYETASTNALNAEEENQNTEKAQELAEATAQAMLNYVSEISDTVQNYTGKPIFETIELGEVLTQTVTNTTTGKETTSNYTGKGILELAFMHLANKGGLAQADKTESLRQQVKDVVADSNIELETTIAIDLVKLTATIGTKIGHTVHYLNIDISSAVTSTNTTEAKKQATDYVLKLLTAAEKRELTTEQLKTITEYNLADITSNRIFSVVNTLIKTFEAEKQQATETTV